MGDTKVKVFAVTPRVVNFITTDKGPMSIADFDDDALRQIGGDWTEKLVEHAQSLRAERAASKEGK